jgi:hypothetical protein
MIPTAPTLEKLRAKRRIREGLDFRGCGKTHECRHRRWKSGPSGPRKSLRMCVGFSPEVVAFSRQIEFFRSLFSRAANSFKLTRASAPEVGFSASDYFVAASLSRATFYDCGRGKTSPAAQQNSAKPDSFSR